MNETSENLTAKQPAQELPAFEASFGSHVPNRPVSQWPCKARFNNFATPAIAGREMAPPKPDFAQAMCIKRAELWLKLGEASQALLELESLPHDLNNHSSVIKLRLVAIRSTRQSIPATPKIQLP